MALLLLLCLPARAQETTLTLGNCTRSVVTYEAVNTQTRYGGSALFYPATTMRMYAGCRITGFYVSLTNWKDIETLRVFVTRDLAAAPLCEREVKPESGGWVYVPLAEPCVPDGGALYVGYTVQGTGMLAYTEARETNEEWINRGKTAGWERYAEGYSAACYAVVEAGPDAPLPACNVRLKDVRFPACALAGQPFAVQATLSNLGTAAVESADLTLLADGKEQVRTVNGLNLPAGESRSLTFDGFVLADEGEPSVQLRVSAVNGQPDADPSDNASAPVELVCRHEFTPRKLLLETFSTERCTGCPAGHEVLTGLFGTDTRVVEVGHHAGFYTDGLTVPESVEYEWFYEPYRLYAPAAMLDRTNFHDRFRTLCAEATPVLDVKENVLGRVSEYALTVPAVVSLTLAVEHGEGERGVCVRVAGDRLLPVPEGTEARLFVYLTEDSLYSETQAGASRGFYHRHVLRRSLTPTWGQPVSLAAPFSADFPTDLPAEWNAGRMRAVAFVAAYDADDRNACRVYNTEAASLVPLFPTAVRALPASAPAAWRHGSRLRLPDGFAALLLRTPDGRTVAHTESAGGGIDLRDFPKGIYLLTLRAPQKTETYKITNY